MIFGPLVSAGWLAANLSGGDVRVLDGSWYPPVQNRDSKAEFAAGHIPGAQFFDIDEIADRTSTLPHMIPTADEFGTAAGALGIGNGHRIVVYDGIGLQSAARVWWTFRVFGHDAVAVLDGGLPAWTAAAGALESETRRPQPETFETRLRPEMIAGLDRVRATVESGGEQVLDARGAGRFNGSDPETRAGVRSGHIPGSLSLPFGDLLDPETQTVRDADSLRATFAAARVRDGTPIITTCGSGITACILALGLELTGRKDVAVYDGSWTEWGGRTDTPVET